MSRTHFADLIFDLGHVFVFYHPHPDAPIPPKAFKNILEGPDWHSYECGHLTQPECFSLVTRHHDLPHGAMDRTVQMCISTFRYSQPVISYVQALKAHLNASIHEPVHIHAMSNISHPEFGVLEAHLRSWDIFDTITTSAQVGMRKPDPEFYKHVLEKSGARPEMTLFADDKKENVRAAETLGMQGVWFINEESGLAELERIFGGLDTQTQSQQMVRKSVSEVERTQDTASIRKQETVPERKGNEITIEAVEVLSI